MKRIIVSIVLIACGAGREPPPVPPPVSATYVQPAAFEAPMLCKPDQPVCGHACCEKGQQCWPAPMGNGGTLCWPPPSPDGGFVGPVAPPVQ